MTVEEKLRKTKILADKMYVMCLMQKGISERLEKAMDEYHMFMIKEFYD